MKNKYLCRAGGNLKHVTLVIAGQYE
jgi:hypothetical protein